MTQTPAYARTAQCVTRLQDLARGDAPWLVGSDRTTTYAALNDFVRALAGFAHQRGLRRGDRVAIITRDDTDSAMIFTACVLNGLTAINLDPETGIERGHAILVAASPCLLLADEDLIGHLELDKVGIPELLPLVRPVPGGMMASLLRKAPVRGGFHGLLAQGERHPPPADTQAETLAYILFTSGTTSAPKGVTISHRALFEHLATLQKVYELDKHSRILNTLMLSHADGMIQGPILALFAGCPAHRPMRFELTRIEPYLDLVYQRRITHLIAVPTMMSMLLTYGQSRQDAFQGGDFKLLVSCGGQLEARLQTDFTGFFRCPLVNVYGLTETVAGALFAGPDADSGVAGSVGRPIDCEARVVLPDGTLTETDQPGELLLRGDLLMSGYFNRDDLTAEVLREGWLHTGDTATQDARGLVRIVGRIKNVIIRGGFNIHPEEVTEALQAHPQVKEAFTLGLPDPVWGEAVVSLVVPADGCTLDATVLLAHCTGRLENQKIPSRITIVKQLPRGRSGKVMVEAARTLFEEATTGSAAAPADKHDTNIEQRLLAIAARCFRTKPERLSLFTTPSDLPGWDSLAHIEFVAKLEEEFGCRFTARDIVGLDRIDKALSKISNG